MEEKVFKTLDDLIDTLKQRGIDIPDPSARDYARRVLEKNGYYNLTDTQYRSIDSCNRIWMVNGFIKIQSMTLSAL